PLPIDETTPPVTNTYLVGFRLLMPDLPISTPERTARERERGDGVGEPVLRTFLTDSAASPTSVPTPSEATRSMAPQRGHIARRHGAAVDRGALDVASGRARPP